MLTRTARILLLGANIWYFGEGMLGPLFAIFAEKVGGDILDITWAWASYLVVTGVVYIIAGRLMNGRDIKEKVMVVGYLLNALLTFCYILVHNPFQLFLVQAGLGIAEAIGTPAWDTLYAKNLPSEVDSYAWGLSTGQSQIVTGIAFAIGGVITEYLSFEALFITMGCIQLMAAGVSMQLVLQKRDGNA